MEYRNDDLESINVTSKTAWSWYTGRWPRMKSWAWLTRCGRWLCFTPQIRRVRIGHTRGHVSRKPVIVTRY